MGGGEPHGMNRKQQNGAIKSNTPLTILNINNKHTNKKIRSARKLQTKISLEHRFKNSLQNFSILNPKIHDSTPKPGGIYTSKAKAV